MNRAKTVQVACLQLNSHQSVADNLRRVLQLATQAIDEKGAQLIVLPENAFCHPYDPSRQAELDKVLPTLQAFCQQQAVWLFAGTIPVSAFSSGKVYSALHVINDRGQVVAVYHKVHLFDVHVADEGVDYCESNSFVAGDKAVVVATPWGNMGLAICYDLRFPELFLAMEKYHPVALVVPSAFTLHTGRKHWHHLVRARAVDQFSWLLAPNQCGIHPGNRVTYGHSAIVNPDGELLQVLAEGEGYICQLIDPAIGQSLRRHIPLASHRRQPGLDVNFCPLT